jgi:hypothetical protein
MTKIIICTFLSMSFFMANSQDARPKKAVTSNFIKSLSLRGEGFFFYLLPNETSFREQERSLGLNLRYSFPNKISVGLFGTTTLKPKEDQLFIVNKSVTNLNSAVYNTFGGLVSYDVMKKSKVNLEFELRMGSAYSELLSIDDEKIANNLTLVVNPRVYLGYDLFKQLEVGLFTGYLQTLHYFSGVETKSYEPNSSNVGAYIQIGIGK